MAQSRKSREMREQVKKLYHDGHGFKKIARALNISKNTVKAIIRESAAVETKPVAALKEKYSWVLKVDWALIGKEFKKGVTIKVLNREHAPEISYYAFRRALYNREPRNQQVSMSLNHKPGEMTFIDFCDGLQIIDPQSNESSKSELFVGVLPFSSYTFAEFVPNQKLETFLRVQDAMWHYFGGITLYVVPDNLKAGVTKAHLYDPDENRTYCEYANHNGFAVLPARPKKPRDKAAVEAAIGVIQRTFYMEVRNEKFYSLAQLNARLKEFLNALNASVMKDYGVSRLERFSEEKKYLRLIPPTQFEMADWRTAKVHPDCEVQVAKNFYTVPHVFVGKEVRVRVSVKLISIFEIETGQAITAHVRLYGIGKHSRYDWHYPSEKIQQTRFEVQSAKAQAKKIGDRTAELIDKLFEGTWPLRGLRRAQGILRLAQGGKYSIKAVEHGADMALKFKKLRVDYIKSCAAHFDKNGAPGPIKVAPQRDLNSMFLHNQKAN